MIDLRETHGGNDIGPGMTVLARWRAEALLDEHGPLAWWRGVELSSGRPVKIVRLRQASDEATRHLAQERAQGLDVLIHPSLPCPLAVDVSGADAMFVVYEMIGGTPLARAVQSGAFTPDRVVALGAGLLDALAACHAVGLAYREIAPDHVRLIDGVDGERLVLEDLPLRSLATLLTEGAAAPRRSPRNGVTGPVLRAAGRIHEEDVAAAGDILHVMLVGRPVLDARQTADYRLLDPRVLLGPPAADIPYEGPLVDFIRHCLAPNPAHRPSSAGDARDTLLAIPSPEDAARPRRVRHATAILGSGSEHLRLDHVHQLVEQWRQGELDRETRPLESLVSPAPTTDRATGTSPLALTTGVIDALEPRRRWRRPAALGAVAVAAMALTWIVPANVNGDTLIAPAATARALAVRAPLEPSRPTALGVAAPSPALAARPIVAEAPSPGSSGPVLRATVTSAPLGASVIVDGRTVGITPMTLAWESNGGSTLALELDLAGHQRSTLTLDSASAGHVVRVEMQPTN